MYKFSIPIKHKEDIYECKGFLVAKIKGEVFLECVPYNKLKKIIEDYYPKEDGFKNAKQDDWMVYQFYEFPSNIGIKKYEYYYSPFWWFWLCSTKIEEDLKK